MRRAALLILLLCAASLLGLWFYIDNATAFFDLAVEGLFERFRDRAFPLALAAAILAVALVLAISYLLLVIAPITLRLRSQVRWLASLGDKPGFARRFDEVRQRLSKDPLIGHVWTEFSETIHEPEAGGQVVHNTVRPHAFINTQQIQDHNFALKVMPHLPNYFVGVGLLLTFVGLVAALNFASGSVGGDVDDALGGLRDLLAAASFKFWTSIAGLGASIVLSFLFRIYANWIDLALIRICDVIESKMHFLTAQSIFAEMQKTADEQLAETKKINSEVAFTIGAKINENLNQQLPQALHTALRPIADEVRRTSEAIVSRNSESVGDMVQKFADSLEGGAGAHMLAISSTLERLQSTLQEMQGSMDSSGDQFSRRIAEGTEQLEVTMRGVSAAVSELVEQLREQMAEAGTSIAGQLEQTLSRISEQSEAAAGQLAAQGKSASRDFAERVEAAARALQESASANAEASAAVAGRLHEELERSVVSMEASISRLSGRLQEVEDSLAEQARAFASIARQEAEVAKALQSTGRSLQEGVGPWRAVGTQLAETLRAVDQSLANSSRRLDDAFDAAKELAEQLGGLAKALENSWVSYRERFEGVDEDLDRAFRQITQAADIQQRRIQDFVKELDQSFSDATDKLNGTISSMAASAEDLADALERWSEAAH